MSRPLAALGAPLDRRAVRSLALLLTYCVTLMQTGYGIAMPVFARRAESAGGGVALLGAMTTSFAAAQFVGAPIAGAVADRVGRRPVMLFALFSFAATNLGVAYADSPWVIVGLRALEGALTAGLLPAALAAIADVSEERERGLWLGVVNGGFGAGLVLGPAIGGLLCDRFGPVAPFTASAAFGALGLVLAALRVPETMVRPARSRAVSAPRTSLPRRGGTFLKLLALDLTASAALGFVLPQMVLYLYERLGFSTLRFGVVVGAYGAGCMAAQVLLGHASDRYGRRPVIVAGLLLYSTLFFGLRFVTEWAALVTIGLVAGVGMGLVAPAISALHIDIAAAQDRSRAIGFRESAIALGDVVGPIALVASASWLTPGQVFTAAGALCLGAVALALSLSRDVGGA